MHPATRPRLVPELPLPPYAYVPGRFPHPVSDPAGHQFAARPAIPTPLEAGAWWSNQAYLWSFDLFNHGYYWESHETWEGLWHAAGRKGTTADFLKGLIKLAAAGVKNLAGTPRGVKSHAGRAAELWRAVARSPAAGQDLCFGLRIGHLIHVAERVCRNGWPDEPVVLLPEFP